MPLAALLWLGAGHGASNKVMLAGFAVIALAMFYNAGLAAFHAGVEWKLWLGPAECSGQVNGFGSASSLLESLQKIHVPRCDEAAWTFSASRWLDMTCWHRCRWRWSQAGA